MRSLFTRPLFDLVRADRDPTGVKYWLKDQVQPGSNCGRNCLLHAVHQCHSIPSRSIAFNLISNTRDEAGAYSVNGA